MNDIQEDESADVLQGGIAFFKEHPAIFGTLLYLQVSAVGVIYSWTLFGAFGINVFDFAETNDFLLAAFKEPFAFAMATVTVGISLAWALFLNNRHRKLFSRLRRHWVLRFQPVFLLFFSLAYTAYPPYIFAKRDAMSVLATPTSVDVLHLRGYRPASGDSTEAVPTTMIGAAGKFLFFYDRIAHRAFAVPAANIVRIELSVHGTESVRSGSTPQRP